MKLKAVTVGILLVCITLGSAALTLGRARGAAWIGQSLELVIPVQLDTGQTIDTLCPEADVFHADSRQDAGRVQVLVEPTPQEDTVNFRVRSSAPIDEPVVTVYLRAGCNQKTTRRYVLLADYPSDSLSPAPSPRTIAEPAPALAPPPLPPVPVAAPDTPSTASVPAPPATAGVAAPRPAIRHAPAVAHKEVSTPGPAAAPRRAAASSPAPATAPPKVAKAGRSRLKLDPLESLAERIKTLEATTTTAVPLEEMVKDSQRIQQLQTDVKALLTQAAKNEANLQVMRERLEKAESERMPAFWVYSLAALVLLCLMAIAFLWNRRSAPPTWRAGLFGNIAQDTGPSALDSELHPPTQLRADSPPNTVLRPKEPNPGLGVDVNLVDMDEESFDKLLKPQPTELAPLAGSPASQAMHGTADGPHVDFNAESMRDLQQQAESLVKLGKTDKAIELLEQRIRANAQDCPLIYLELLHIANVHSLKTDFRQFRDEFEKVFNAAIPEFALFRNEGRSLKDYPSLLKHISTLWPTPKVLDVIESCVLRDRRETNAEPLDLAAFRELIMLHGIASAQLPGASVQGSTEDGGNTQHVDLDI